ncbi:MAG: (d)CMP kinase [Lactobacillales bacterium]|jgi:cytidylate kinase|nr:(d)CMP kinase [Lactobacillales bacterium]
MNIITVDGYSSTGKGTLAKKLAEYFDYAYMDTGAMYRFVALNLLRRGLGEGDIAAAIQIAENMPFEKIPQIQTDPDIRSPEVGALVSKIATIPEVRSAVARLQHKLGEKPVTLDGRPAKGLSLDGRDIGTVIFPKAKYKIFLTADPTIRANRRLKELQSAGKCVTFNDVLSELTDRDRRDTERKNSPTIPAKDAFILDTTDLTIDEVFARVVDFIRNK